MAGGGEASETEKDFGGGGSGGGRGGQRAGGSGEGAGRGQARPGGSAGSSCPRAPPPPPEPRSRAESSHQLSRADGPHQPAGVREAAAQGGAARAHVAPAAAMADSGPAGGAALAAPAPGPGGGGPGPRVYFQSPPGAAGEGPGSADDDGPVRRQGKVTVKYDRKELRKRLNLEEWILEQLTRLYDCQVCPRPAGPLGPVPRPATWEPRLEPACHPQAMGASLPRAPPA